MYPSKTNNFDKWQMQNAYVITCQAIGRFQFATQKSCGWTEQNSLLLLMQIAQHATTTLSLMQIAQHATRLIQFRASLY